MGLSFLAFGFSILKVKWNNYRFKIVNIVTMILSILLISLYQFIIIFTQEHEEKFFPYSAFFLKFNVLCMSFLIFFSKYTGKEDMLNLLTTYFPKRGIDMNRDREDDMQGEIKDQMKNKEWKPSYEDLTDIITISKVSTAKFMSAVGGGYVQRFNSKSAAAKNTIKIAILVFSAAILFLNALVLYLADDKSKMGIVTSTSVLLMDFFTFLLYHS